MHYPIDSVQIIVNDYKLIYLINDKVVDESRSVEIEEIRIN